MANRTRFDPRINPVLTQPTAAPVDTYKRPGVTPGQQLAQALSEVAPKLSRLGESLSVTYMDDQREKGAQAARLASEQAMKAGDMTRMGELPMQENPYFMSAYEEEWGRVAAGFWQSDLKAAMNEDQNLQESTNMADFDKFVGDHLKAWGTSHKLDRSTEFERGFGGMKDQYVAMARLNFAEGIEKKLDKNSDEALFALVNRHIKDNWGRDGVDATSIASGIEMMARFQVLRGRPEGKVAKAITAAIRAAAIEAGPEKGLEILDLMQQVSGEKGKGSLANQSYGAEAFSETRKELIVEGQQQAERARRKKEQDKAELRDNLAKEGLQILKDNPNANLTSFLRQHPEADPETVSDLRALQAQYQDLKYHTNQYVFQNLFNSIWAEGGPQVSIADIVAQSKNNNLTPEDSYKLIQMLEGHKGRSKKDPLDERAEPYLKLANSLADDIFKDPTTGVAAGDRAERVRNAKSELLYRWDQKKNTGSVEAMNEADLNQWFMDQMNAIVKSQASQFNIKLSPAVTPQVGVSEPFQPLGAGPQKAAAEKPKVINVPILTKKDLADLAAGKTSGVEAKMRERGIQPADMKQFVMEQAKLLSAKTE